jgi:hypothetical protein
LKQCRHSFGYGCVGIAFLLFPCRSARAVAGLTKNDET